MNRTTIAALSALALTATAGLLIAGPLSPPGGPVGSTYKTLTEVEPRIALSAANTPGNASSIFRITQPGSYYLTANISGNASKVGIKIETSGVSVDLNGFTIDYCSSGVAATNNNSELDIHNGTITASTGVAVDLRLCTYCRVADLRVDSYNVNSGDSISMYDYATVSRCQVYGYSAGVGVKVGSSAVVRDCIVASSTSHCFQIGSASRVSDCTASYAGGDGFYITGANSIISGCTASQCAFHGFELTDSNIIETCSSFWNSHIGIVTASESTVRNCTVGQNVGQGIVCIHKCTIIGNRARDNGVNGSAAIWAQGGQNRIEGNDMSNNGYGVYVGGTGNTIIRNSVTQNTTNFYIVAGNHVGLIVTPSTNGALINGSTGGGLGTTDPNANFVY